MEQVEEELVNQIKPRGRLQLMSNEQLAKHRLKQRPGLTEQDLEAIDNAFAPPNDNTPAYASDYHRFNMEPVVDIEYRKHQEFLAKTRMQDDRKRTARLQAEKERMMERERDAFGKLSHLMAKKSPRASSVQYNIVTHL